MVKHLKILRCMTLAVVVLGLPAMAQLLPPGVTLPSDNLPPPKPKRKPKPAFSTYLPARPSLSPAAVIELSPLGFVPPKSSYYLGRKIHLVSLDFLDEDRLLFTFHPSGLMRREADDAGTGVQRQIKALVLRLPEGKVEAEAAWAVSDRERYLWMLKGGRFLLLTGDGLEQGDERLQLTPLPDLPDPKDRVLSIALNPGQQILVTTSPAPNPPGSAAPIAQSRFAPEGTSDAQSDLILRVIERSSGKVILTRPGQAISSFPVSSAGYVEASSPQKYHWVLTLKSFNGNSKVLTDALSGCLPRFNFISDEAVFLTTCTPEGGLRLAALTTEGRTLWATDAPPEPVWPLLVMAPNGSRFAREALVLNESVNLKKHPKFVKAIHGQEVKVLGAANGSVIFEAPLDPILDGGGNVAFSPSGRRFAIVNDGAIQVFDLPPVTSTSGVAGKASAH